MTRPKRQLSKMTLAIMAESTKLTNKQVADKLGTDTETVRKVRHRNGIPHGGQKRNRGLKERIAAYYGCNDADTIAAALGCSKSYLQKVWREIRNG